MTRNLVHKLKFNWSTKRPGKWHLRKYLTMCLNTYLVENHLSRIEPFLSILIPLFPSDVTAGSAWRMHHGFVLILVHDLKCLFLHQFTSRPPNASLMIESHQERDLS